MENRAVTEKALASGNRKNTDDDEIDLLEIFYVLKKKIWLILFVGVLFAAVFGTYNRFFVTQLYKSTATIFIMDSNSVISLSDLQLSNAINGDYQLIIKGREVANKVIQNLGLEMDYRQLQSLITVSNPTDTHAIEITATTDSPDAAVVIANEVTNVSIKEISDVLDVSEPRTMEMGAAEAVVTVDKGFVKYTVMGFLLGALLVIGIYVIKVIFDTTVKDEDDVEKYFALPTLSAVPYHTVTESTDKNDVPFARVPDKKYVRPIHQELNFDTVEALSTLRTNMFLSGYDKKVFMFTSLAPDEGKSFISYQLARNIAEMKKKVIFVDCDTRNSVLRRGLGLKKKVFGVTEYLCGQAELKDVIYGTDTECFDFLFSGTSAPNPTDLYESERFANMVAALKQSYDYVIIDTAPLGMVIDAAIIAKHCDGTVIVAESGRDDYRAVGRIVRQLSVTNVDIVGVVLNKINLNKNNYYGHYGYGHEYGYGYGYGYGQTENDKGKKKAAGRVEKNTKTVKRPSADVTEKKETSVNVKEETKK
jgi:capsular exopolysaccharide synthesis family protein